MNIIKIHTNYKYNLLLKQYFEQGNKWLKLGYDIQNIYEISEKNILPANEDNFNWAYILGFSRIDGQPILKYDDITTSMDAFENITFIVDGELHNINKNFTLNEVFQLPDNENICPDIKFVPLQHISKKSKRVYFDIDPYGEEDCDN